MTNSVRTLIEEMRGFVPDRCDFCGQKTEPKNLHPEEAGEWACIVCMDRWLQAEKEEDMRADD